MNALLFSFSARKNAGNCSKIINFISNELTRQNIKCLILNAKELDIRPCRNCNYECFDGNSICPIHDDVLNIYKYLMENDIVIMVVPTYGGAPPSMYFAFHERAQAFFKTYEMYEDYKNIKRGYIVIGNKESGGLQTLDILLDEDKSNDKIKSLLIQSNEFGQKSVEGNLIEFKKVREDIKIFLRELIK